MRMNREISVLLLAGCYSSAFFLYSLSNGSFLNAVADRLHPKHPDVFAMRILILGTGGVGGYIGAKLCDAGGEVTFLARGRHLAAMQENGLTLEGPGDNITARGVFTDSVSNLPPFDVIIVAVKSQDTWDVAHMCRACVHNDTIVLTIQNGVENAEILGEVLGSGNILGGIAFIFSTIAAAGIIHHHGGITKFKIGESDGSQTPRCTMVAELFHHAGMDLEVVPDIRRAMWEKFIFICGLGGMTAYTRSSIGDILRNDKLHGMLQKVVSEAAEVARIKKIDRFIGIEDKADAHYHRLHPGNTSSMCYDVMHGKRVEVKALNGAVVRFGQALQKPCPFNTNILNALLPYA